MTEDARALRVRRVLAVARRVRDAGDPLGLEARARLATTSGLSPEGVDLALSECLETDATPDDLSRLLDRVGDAPTTWVVASANVCTAAVRSIALAVATSPRVVVRPSRRDPVLAEIVARELAADAAFIDLAGSIAIAAELAPSVGDEVHAYGRDDTLAAIAASLPPSVTLRGHGTGFGVAVVDADADLARAAAAIARDVVRFDQRGCLSPRIVLCSGFDRAGILASALHAELALWRARVPAGPLPAEERAALAVFRRSMEAIGDVYGDEAAFAVAIEAPRSATFPPPARALAVMAVTAERIESLFAGPNGGIARFVAAIGRDNGNGALARSLTAVAPRARVSSLGEMQRPPLDGPVDLRHLRE